MHGQLVMVKAFHQVCSQVLQEPSAKTRQLTLTSTQSPRSSAGCGNLRVHLPHLKMIFHTLLGYL